MVSNSNPSINTKNIRSVLKQRSPVPSIETTEFPPRQGTSEGSRDGTEGHWGTGLEFIDNRHRMMPTKS